jgi:hypothetical protein
VSLPAAGGERGLADEEVMAMRAEQTDSAETLSHLGICRVPHAARQNL